MVHNSAFNGFSGNQLLNAHFTYKGRSVIIDYEWVLHTYSEGIKNSTEKVAFEMYPYNGDIYVDYVDLDSRFKKADMSQILEKIDKALEDENEDNND